MDAGEIVTEFCAAWSTRDVDHILSYFLPEAVYHNIPLYPITGADNIRRGIDIFVARADAVRFDVKTQLVDGSVVMNERVDTFVIGGTEITVPAAGVFELRDGKIAVWRDYFDVQQAEGLLP